MLLLICSDGENRLTQEDKIFKAGETIGSIDITWMANTIHWFPIDVDVDGNYVNNQIFSSKKQSLYDPRFFLSLTATLVSAPSSQFDAHRLLETNLIGLAVCSLSSNVTSTRRVGHFILSKFYAHLLEADIKERNQVLLLLDNFRNSIISTEENVFAIVPFLMTAFVAQ